MKPQATLAAAIERREWNPSPSAGGLLRALTGGLVRGMETAQVYIDHHGNAMAAEELYKHLSRLSDAELARRGLSRDQIAQYVKRGL